MDDSEYYSVMRKQYSRPLSRKKRVKKQSSYEALEEKFGREDAEMLRFEKSRSGSIEGSE